MVSPLPVQTRARIRALQARIAEVAAAGGASASAHSTRRSNNLQLEIEHGRFHVLRSAHHFLVCLQLSPLIYALLIRGPLAAGLFSGLVC
jgi:hypothetical protein